MAHNDNLQYPNLAIFFSILFLTFLFSQTGLMDQIVESLGVFGYFSAFAVGIFFVSTFTVVPATALLFLMGETLNIPAVSVLAGLGAVVGDYTIFKFVKDDLTDELKSVFRRVGGEDLTRFHFIIHTKYFAWLGPVLGAILIASPLPDELGVGLLGVYKLDDRQFALLSFILNTIGIFLLLSSIEAIAV